jgi:hypothetical protein
MIRALFVAAFLFPAAALAQSPHGQCQGTDTDCPMMHSQHTMHEHPAGTSLPTPRGMHHQQHHLMIARGEKPHG